MVPTPSIPSTKNMGDTHVLVFIFFSISYIHGHVYSWEIGNYSKYILVINEIKFKPLGRQNRRKESRMVVAKR